MHRSISSTLVLLLGASLSSPLFPGNVAARDAKAAECAVDAWARAVGGWKQLDKSRGATLHGKRIEGGIDSGFEA